MELILMKNTLIAKKNDEFVQEKLSQMLPVEIYWMIILTVKERNGIYVKVIFPHVLKLCILIFSVFGDIIDIFTKYGCLTNVLCGSILVLLLLGSKSVTTESISESP